VTRLLSVRPLVWVGLISYSAYLWHWPMFALYRYGYGPIGWAAGAAMLAATLLIAWASYRYVEQPARASPAPPLRIFARYYVAPVAVLLAASLIVIYPERAGITLASDEYRRRLDEMRNWARPASDADSACQRMRVRPSDLADPRCVAGATLDSPAAALLWGDSNAVHYIGMIEAFARESGFRFRNIAVGTCPPILSDPASFVEPKRLADCRASLDAIRPVVDEFPVIILAASWTFYRRQSAEFLGAVESTAQELARANKKVIIMGRVPVIRGYDRRCREKALTFPFRDCPTEGGIPADIAATNAELRRFADRNPNIRYFDATDYLCPKGRCTAFRTDGQPKYFDAGHLTHAASRDLGAQIVARDGVPPMFLAIGAAVPPGVPR